MIEFDWRTRTEYNDTAKFYFHMTAKRQLRKLANELGLEPKEFDLRSNMGGIAVSGEITLHTDNTYIQVSQSSMGPEHGILFRTCKGRKDYTGGRNHFAHLKLLNDPYALAHEILSYLGEEKRDYRP
jgi:hypothetical protein